MCLKHKHFCQFLDKADFLKFIFFKGKCSIAFKHSTTIDAALDYTLMFDEDSSEDRLSSSLQLDRYVIMLSNSSEKSLQIRFPVRGIYKVNMHLYLQ